MATTLIGQAAFSSQEATVMIVSSIEVDRPPGEVFDYATDPAKFPEWQKDVVAVTFDGAQRQGAGTKFRTVRRIGAMTRTLLQEVTASQRPETWTASGRDGPILATGSIAIEPIRGGAASKVTFTLAYEARGAGRLLMPLIMRQTRSGAPKSYRNLKAILESRGETG